MTLTLSIIKTYVWLYSFLSILQMCFSRKSSFQIQMCHSHFILLDFFYRNMKPELKKVQYSMRKIQGKLSEI